MSLTFIIATVVVGQQNGTDVQFVQATLSGLALPTFTTDADNATPVQLSATLDYVVPIDTIVTVGQEITVTLS